MIQDNDDWSDLKSPRIWIYIVMTVGGMAWGIWFIYHAIATRGL